MRMLMVVAAWGIGLAWLVHRYRLWEVWGAKLFVAAIWAGVAWATFEVVRRERGKELGLGARLVLDAVAAASVVTTLYVIWAYQRVAWGDWTDLETGFPYPDMLINRLERWYDAMHPLPDRDHIKMHGEYPRVIWTLSVAILVLLGVSGIVLGLRFPRRKAMR